ncbi:TniB family protein [Rippkaea orientalis PCC 8801]|uniref:TniB family protein n=1 Tax=Rippkaea orientalis (strain PCC 8801 / RF-1) TaxID=41431 RepID=B7JWC6_RIPO1|nr:TniB family NTP-binding protein [Rippkaea orientalis]ACK66971.1 TniB family protein [Rippkaea orientalis PCC 8801]
MTDSSVIDKLAAEFGGFATPSPEIQAEIQRLSRQPYLEYEQVKNCHGWLYELVLSRMTGLLVGESRSGKTVTCKSFEKRYNKIKTGNKKRIKPIVYIQSPQNCGAREFFTKILKALNKPTNGNVSDLRERTLDGLQIHECEMLIIDEANHLKQETFAEVRHVYDEEELNMAVLLVGTRHRLEAVVKRDEQVLNRFMEEYELDRLDDKEFKQLIKIWEQSVLCLPELSNLDTGDNLKLLKKTTRKLIGRLDMILRKSAIRALREGKQSISPELLKQVISSIKWSEGRKGNG